MAVITRLLEVPVCHLKLRDSKQECCGLVARVTTSHVTLLDPWWLQQHGVGRVQGHSAPRVCSSLYSLRAMSRSRNPVRQHELTSKDSKQKPEDEAKRYGDTLSLTGHRQGCGGFQSTWRQRRDSL